MIHIFISAEGKCCFSDDEGHCSGWRKQKQKCIDWWWYKELWFGIGIHVSSNWKWLHHNSAGPAFHDWLHEVIKSMLITYFKGQAQQLIFRKIREFRQIMFEIFWLWKMIFYQCDLVQMELNSISGIFYIFGKMKLPKICSFFMEFSFITFLDNCENGPIGANILIAPNNFGKDMLWLWILGFMCIL